MARTGLLKETDVTTMFDIETSDNIVIGGEEMKPTERQRKPRKREFYIMTFDYSRAERLGFTLEDESVLPYGQFDFLNFSEPPSFIFDLKRGRLPEDLELYRNFWLVSDRTKSAFQATDPTAFAFLECNVKLPDGDYDGPGYWLCNVTRILDVLDEAQSILKVGIREDPRYVDFGKKYYDILGRHELVFRDEAIGDAHVFRMEYLRRTIVCDETMKDACEAARLKGVKFDDTSNC